MADSTNEELMQEVVDMVQSKLEECQANNWENLSWDQQIDILKNADINKTIGLLELIYPNKTIERISVTDALNRAIKIMEKMNDEILDLEKKIDDLENDTLPW